MRQDMEFGDALWRKSSYSNETACVEVGWRKSSHSSETADCVEIAHLPAVVGIRDSKNPQGGHLALAHDAFRQLCQGLGRSK